MTPGSFALLSMATAMVSWLIVRGMRGWASRHLLDVPNARSSHSRPTPRGGGLGIVGAVTLCWAFVALGAGGRVGPLAFAALLVAAVSAIDDVRTLPVGVRFGVHTLGAGLILWGYGAPTALALPGVSPLELPALAGGALFLFWCVALTNVYNFMDGIDGIAGVQAVAAGAGWALAGLALGHPALAATGLGILAAALGFLGHNWAPARIFMGDVGSAFLGFTFAALVAVGGDLGGGRVPLAAVLFVWPFIFDGTYTLIRRLLRGENVLAAHRSHLYQRQVIAGRSHAATSTLYGVVALMSTAAGVAWLLDVPGGGWGSVTVAAAIAGFLLAFTRRCEAASSFMPPPPHLEGSRRTPVA